MLVRFEALMAVFRVVGAGAFVFGLRKLDDTLIEVAQILEQVIVVCVDKLGPFEFTVRRLRTSRQQIKSPDLAAPAVSKYTVPRVREKDAEIRELLTLGSMPVSLALFPKTPTPFDLLNLDSS